MKRTILLCIAVAYVVGCATTTTLTIESDPTQAHVLSSKAEEGPWENYREREGQHITPSVSKIKKDEFFWVKLKKKGYQDSEPQFVRGSEGEKVHVKVNLEPVGDTAIVYVDSDPKGAQVLVSESMDGDYVPWPEADGEPITPARGELPIGDSLWIKVAVKGYADSEAEYVHIESDDAVHLAFKLTKWKRRAEGAQRARFTVTTTPPGATVLVSDEEFGHYEPWPPADTTQVTPLDVMLDVGQEFWLKLRKDQYDTTKPQHVVVEPDEPIAIQAVLQLSPRRQVPERNPAAKSVQPVEQQAAAPQAPVAPQAPAETGIVANGFAIVRGDAGIARNAAIMDALGVAIQQKYGAQITAQSIANNYLLMSNRIESKAEGRYATYDVLDESHSDGIYRVTLRVKFRGDLLASIRGENVSFLLGGKEMAAMEEGNFGATSARRAVSDALIEASMRVTALDDPVANAKELAQLAQDNQCDLALYIGAASELHDKFGGDNAFYAYKSAIDYHLVVPISGDIIADGRIEGFNEKRQLSAKDAAIHSLRETGEKVADEVLHKLVARYDRAASYRVYVTGIADHREAEMLVNELGALPGVRDARLLACEADVCEIALVISPDARPAMSAAVQRLKNVDLNVVEADLYTTVASKR